MATWLEISTHISAVCSLLNFILILVAHYKVYRRRTRQLLSALGRWSTLCRECLCSVLTCFCLEVDPEDIEAGYPDGPVTTTTGQYSETQPLIGPVNTYSAGGRYLPSVQYLPYGTAVYRGQMHEGTFRSSSDLVCVRNQYTYFSNPEYKDVIHDDA